MMPSPRSTETTAWNLVRDALRPSLSAAPSDATPPLGFATRVAATYASLQRDEKTRLWVRLSLQGALGSAALLAVACVLMIASPESHAQEPTVLLVAPTLELPVVQ